MSDILFKCTHCSKRLAVDGAAVGRTVKCVDCGQPVKVPVGACAAVCPACSWEVALSADLAGERAQCPNCGEELDAPTPSRGTVPDLLFRCPGCAKGMAVGRESEGKTVKCVGCGHSIAVPKPEVMFSCLSCTLNLSAPAKAAGDVFKCPSCGSRCQVPDVRKGFSLGASKRCDCCGELMSRAVMVCPACGVDQRTGKPRLMQKKDATSGAGTRPNANGLRDVEGDSARVKGNASTGAGIDWAAYAASQGEPAGSQGASTPDAAPTSAVPGVLSIVVSVFLWLLGFGALVCADGWDMLFGVGGLLAALALTGFGVFRLWRVATVGCDDKGIATGIVVVLLVFVIGSVLAVKRQSRASGASGTAAKVEQRQPQAEAAKVEQRHPQTAAEAAKDKGSISGGCFLTMAAGNVVVARGETVYLLPRKLRTDKGTTVRSVMDVVEAALDRNIEEIKSRLDGKEGGEAVLYTMGYTDATTFAGGIAIANDSIDAVKLYEASRSVYTHCDNNLGHVYTMAMVYGLQRHNQEIRAATDRSRQMGEIHARGLASDSAMRGASDEALKMAFSKFQLDFEQAFLDLPTGLDADPQWRRIAAECSAASVKTGMDGKYRFDGVPQGDYVLFASFGSGVNYCEWCVPVTVTRDGVSQVFLDNKTATHIWRRRSSE